MCRSSNFKEGYVMLTPNVIWKINVHDIADIVTKWKWFNHDYHIALLSPIDDQIFTFRRHLI